MDKVVSVLLCAAGVVLVLQPDFIFTRAVKQTTGTNTSNFTQKDIINEASRDQKVLNSSNIPTDSNQDFAILGCGLSVVALLGSQSCSNIMTIFSPTKSIC